MTIPNERQALGEKPMIMTKSEMLVVQFKNIASMVTCLSSTYDVHDKFPIGNMNFNGEKNNKVKINNLKLIRNLIIILEEELKTKVKIVLDL
jgi:hypothetical protein